jgi:hypothetical protein
MGAFISSRLKAAAIRHGRPAINKPAEAGRFHGGGSVFSAILRPVHPPFDAYPNRVRRA